MTQPKVYSDTDSKLLGEAMAHNGEALRIILSLVRSSAVSEGVKVQLGIVSTHLGLSQHHLAAMEKIRAVNSRRGKKAAEDASA